MATIDITFQQMSFPSLQIGDTAYYITTGESGGFINANENNLVEIGEITNITATPPTITDFILFAKDNRVNVSSLVGYHGTVRFRNNAIVKAEMFSTACDISESSK